MEDERTGTTSRQREVHRLVARGHTNGEIAKALGISHSGVKWHVSELLMRYSVDSREELVEAWRNQASPWQRIRGFAANAGPLLSPKVAGMAMAGVAGVAGLSIVVAAVTGGGSFDGLLRRDEPEMPAVMADFPPPAVEPVNPSTWISSWREANPVQRLSMLDGKVTYQEVREAVLLTKSCIEGHGMTATTILHEPSQSADIAASYRSSGDPKVEARRQVETDRCYEEYWDGIHFAWGARYSDSAESVAAARAAIAECMVNQGFDEPPVDDPAEWEEMFFDEHDRAYPNAYGGCLESLPESLGMTYQFSG